MMMFNGFQENVDQKLEELSVLSRVAFGAACCERLLPNYLAFWITESWGNFATLSELLDLVWAWIEDPLKSEPIRIVQMELLSLGPDDEEFSSIFCPLAADAVSSLAYTVESCLAPGKSLENSRYVSRLAFDSMYQYLAQVNDPELAPHIEDSVFHNQIFDLPLFRAEIRRQIDDLDLLRDAATPTAEELTNLRESASRTGIQPIRRGLVKELSG